MSEMTDREMVELAAKAAGLKIEFMFDNAPAAFLHYDSEWPRSLFSPLFDDGDALRLAVKLGIDETFSVVITGARGYVAACDANLKLSGAQEKLLEDPYATTRRAIVRAAAEIGKQMP